jgi:hypothetical protein
MSDEKGWSVRGFMLGCYVLLQAIASHAQAAAVDAESSRSPQLVLRFVSTYASHPAIRCKASSWPLLQLQHHTHIYAVNADSDLLCIADHAVLCSCAAVAASAADALR